MSHWTEWVPYATEYDPLKVGSIDGTDVEPHDVAIWKAMQVKYKPNKGVIGDPHLTLFVARLNFQTTEETLHKVFSKYGQIRRIRLVRDIVTGISKRYAFIEYKEMFDVLQARREANKVVVDQHEVFVDMELERTLKGWVPRRFGGGLGGKKESGQLRFGGRDRPFRRPIIHDLALAQARGIDLGIKRRERDEEQAGQTSRGDRHRAAPYYNRETNRGDRHRAAPYDNRETNRGDRHRAAPYDNKETNRGDRHRAAPYDNRETNRGDRHRAASYDNRETNRGDRHRAAPYDNRVETHRAALRDNRETNSVERPRVAGWDNRETNRGERDRSAERDNRETKSRKRHRAAERDSRETKKEKRPRAAERDNRETKREERHRTTVRDNQQGRDYHYTAREDTGLHRR